MQKAKDSQNALYNDFNLPCSAVPFITWVSNQKEIFHAIYKECKYIYDISMIFVIC